ncbi:MAG: response regulator [Deltaproteobacteria bacterium]|nr:response regulator [Deltaproteobacteria bacterium]
MKTVRAPAELAELFARAEEMVSAYFDHRQDDPGRGVIEVLGERYVLVRAASLSVEFFALVRELYGAARQAEADDFARNLLFDLAHAIGRTDARRLHDRMKIEDPLARLAAGPVHFSHTGWAFVDIHADSRPVTGDEYLLVYDHPYSFEASAWLERGERAAFPVCIMNAGYSSGWCEVSFGTPLVASEILCRARGDEACRFIMAPPERLEERVRKYLAGRPGLADRARGYQIPDFFARKRIEEDLRRARDELELRVAERTAELESANRRLQEEMCVRQRLEDDLLQAARLETIGRLAGGIAHDFNNLMGVVIGQASLLERTLESGSESGQLVREIRKTGEEAAQLTQQLLSFSRVQAPQAEPSDLNDVVRGTVRMLGQLLGDSVRVALELSATAGAVRIDRGQLGQVVMNLVLNARDAMPAGGTVRVRTAGPGEAAGTDGDPEGGQAGGRTLLEVSDTGVGMDEATLARAFEPFFTTKAPGTGTGLGLSTARGVVNRAGGTVTVASRRGSGTTFRIFLPPAASGDGKSFPAQPAAGLPRGTETILVVEDLRSLRQMMVGMLAAQGYRVIEAPDPETALETAAAHDGPIQLLVTDVVMPRLNGRELAERLAAARPGLRVLFVSGYPDDDLLRFGIEQGTADLLAKPFKVERLAERVREVLDRPSR